MKIVLIGYMGSGKSTSGDLLAKNLKVDFIDLDTYITKNITNPSLKFLKMKEKKNSANWKVHI